MAVGVEAGRFLLPMTHCGSSGRGAPHPPHRQAAGRYVSFTLAQWYIERNFNNKTDGENLLGCGDKLSSFLVSEVVSCPIIKNTNRKAKGAIIMTPDDKMQFVLKLARKAMESGELPIAAAIYNGDELISAAHTSEIADRRFLVHAEQKALMEADMKKLPIEVRVKLELYINMEPCLMCLGTAMSSFVNKVYYGVEAPDDGAVDFVRKKYEDHKIRGLSIWHFPETTGGLLREQSIQLFREYVEQNAEKGIPGMVEFAQVIASL